MCIQSNYRNNPFHNFRHCFCVAQMMYGLIHLCELNKVMSRVELGILLVAAICHDLVLNLLFYFYLLKLSN